MSYCTECAKAEAQLREKDAEIATLKTDLREHHEALADAQSAFVSEMEKGERKDTEIGRLREKVTSLREVAASAHARFYTLDHFCLRDEGLKAWVEGALEKLNDCIMAIDAAEPPAARPRIMIGAAKERG